MTTIADFKADITNGELDALRGELVDAKAEIARLNSVIGAEDGSFEDISPVPGSFEITG